MKEFTTGNGRRAIELVEGDSVAIFLDDNKTIQINQKDHFGDSEFKYDKVFLSKEVIIALAEKLKGEF